MKYSFSEVHHNKSVPIIEVKEKTNLDYKLVPLKPLRDMRIIEGPIEELLKKENYEGTNLDDYIMAIVTNEEPIYDAIGQIRRIYPNTLRLDIKNSKTKNEFENNFSNVEKIKQKSEIELFEEFFEFQNNVQLTDKQKDIMNEIITSIKEK